MVGVGIRGKLWECSFIGRKTSLDYFIAVGKFISRDFFETRSFDFLVVICFGG